MRQFTLYQGAFVWQPGGGDKPVVIANGKLLPLACDTAFGCHSPMGFAWGHEGSGPAQLALALALLVHHLGRERFDEMHRAHPGLYQQFKARVIAKLPEDGEWHMTSADIDEALVAIAPEYTPPERYEGTGVSPWRPPIIGMVGPRWWYDAFLEEPVRAHSKEKDFGTNWTMPDKGGVWRVSYVEDTGELYAVKAARCESCQGFVHLGFYYPDRVENLMCGWAESSMVLTEWFPGLQTMGAVE